MHPVHADAVASVVGRADVLSCVFFLLSFMCYVRHARARDARALHNRQQVFASGGGRTRSSRPPPVKTDVIAVTAYLAFCVLFALLSVLAKENGISVMAVCIGYELMLRLRSINGNKVTNE